MKVTSENYDGKLYIKLGKKHIPLEQDIVFFEKLERENKELKAQIEKMKCCFNCDKPIKHLDCGVCHNGSNWELAHSDKLIRSSQNDKSRKN